STVAGGYQNQAKNNQSTVGGGYNNKAEGHQSTVAGGHSNIAKGETATVSGGYNNKAEGNQSTVGGGSGNQATGKKSTVSGGDSNQATNEYSTVGGGSGNQATGEQSTISGGDANKATNWYSSVGGGRLNQATGRNSTVAGGYDNRATGIGSFAAGVENKANTDNAVAVGKKNIIEGENSAAIGSNNTVENGKKDVFILGSNTNTTNAQSGSVLLGNKTAGKQATAVNNATVNGLTLENFAGTSAENGVVSVGREGGERQIVNVGAGQISATSTCKYQKTLERKQENDIKEVVSMQNAIAEQADKNKNHIQGLAKAQLAGGAVMEELNKNVEANKADIANNTDSIAKNKADIKDLDDEVGVLSQDIGSLHDDVAKNQADIAKNQADIKTLAKAGSENTQNIEDLAAYNELQDAYAKQQTDAIDALNKASSENTKRITTAELGIAENKKDAQIAKAQANENKADIAANKADADAKFKGVQTDIANNKITLAQHTKKIDDNQQAIEAKLGGKADLQKLAELKTSVDKNQADIAANKADADASFETLTKNQNTLIEQGEAQDALIAQNQTDITANKTAIEQNVNRTVANGFEIEKNKAGIATNKQELIIQNNRLNRIDETNNRQDQKIDQLGYTLKEQGQYFNSRISAVERQTAGGIANAIAIATLPSPNRAGEHHVLFGSGYHNGQAAVSLGAAGSSDTGKSTYKIGLSWSDAGGLSGGVGGSYRWK
ncbi:YadA-like family protein, partial [Moraxella catarrhalis]|uniref:YadA-like family protein n=1 Tax=Moraxella catarrhalis TaxID=480 RepID=UPI0007E40E67